MAILKVASLGHPVLRQKAVPVQPAQLEEPWFKSLLNDLVETMREYDGVGIAAPQVHVGLRVFAMEVANNLRYPDAPNLPLTIVINPELSLGPEPDETLEAWEGCLSIPGLRGCVARRSQLVLRGLDPQGKEFSSTLSGFAARIVQHEVDHLDGRVFLDGMRDFTKLAFQKEYEKYHHARPPSSSE